MKEINGERRSALVGGGGENKVEMRGKAEDWLGALAPGSVGILGRRSLRPQLSPQALTGSSLAPQAGGPGGGLLLLPGAFITHSINQCL